MIDPNIALEASAALVTAIGGIYGVFKHLNSRMSKKKEKYRAAILAEAKEEMSRIKGDLEQKIKALEIELSSQKNQFNSDLKHIKEDYVSGMRVVGEKINDMKDQLNQQHAQLVALLTRMVER